MALLIFQRKNEFNLLQEKNFKDMNFIFQTETNSKYIYSLHNISCKLKILENIGLSSLQAKSSTLKQKKLKNIFFSQTKKGKNILGNINLVFTRRQAFKYIYSLFFMFKNASKSAWNLLRMKKANNR